MNNSSGNVLFLILIAVALFAALSYAVTSSTRTSGGSTSAETANIQASQMLSLVSSIRTAITRVTVGGIAPTSLCFDTPGWLTISPAGSTWYPYAGCSVNAAKIFDPAGGGIIWFDVPKELKTTGTPAYDTFWITGAGAVQDIGTTATDLILFLTMDRLNGNAIAFCNAINKKLGITYDLVAADDVNPNSWRSGFIGNFSASPSSSEIIGDSLTIFAGQPTGCFREGHTGGYLIFYSVLLER